VFKNLNQTYLFQVGLSLRPAITPYIMADLLQSNQSFSPSTLWQRFYPFSSCDRLPIRSDQYRFLWCLILGDREPFKVSLPLGADVDVDDLKQVIHVKGVDTTRYTTLPKDLVVWKVWT